MLLLFSCTCRGPAAVLRQALWTCGASKSLGQNCSLHRLHGLWHSGGNGFKGLCLDLHRFMMYWVATETASSGWWAEEKAHQDPHIADASGQQLLKTSARSHQVNAMPSSPSWPSSPAYKTTRHTNMDQEGLFSTSIRRWIYD